MKGLIKYLIESLFGLFIDYEWIEFKDEVKKHLRVIADELELTDTSTMRRIVLLESYYSVTKLLLNEDIEIAPNTDIPEYVTLLVESIMENSEAQWAGRTEGFTYITPAS